MDLKKKTTHCFCVFFFLYFCRTLSQSGEGQVRSPGHGIPKGNVSCVFYWPVCWFPDWTQQFLFVFAIWCEWKRKYVNSLRQPSWGRLLRDTADRKEMFLARGATCKSTVFFFCDSRRRFLCLDVCLPPRVGLACRSSILPFLFTLCVRVLWLLLVLWRCVASSLCLFCYCFFHLFIFRMHALSIWSGLLWPPPAREHCADPPGKTLHTGPAAPQSSLLSPCLINRP